MKSKIKSELREHGSAKRFKAIKKAKTPLALAKVIIKQHAAGKLKACKKCGRVASRCSCK